MRKRVLFIAVAFAALISLSACGNNTNEPPAEAVEPTTESVAPAEETAEAVEPTVTEETSAEESTAEPEAEEDENVSYAKLYLDEIEELHTSGKADLFLLINVDGDDVPELAALNSEGPSDENLFLYTVYEGDVTLLESVAAGFDGQGIEFAEGKNMIKLGSAMGGYNTYEFKKIVDGDLEEVSTFLEVGIDDTEEYHVDDEEVSKEEFFKKESDFIAEYNPFTDLGSNPLNECTYSYNGDYLDKEAKEAGSYKSYDEIKEELEKA